MGRNRDFYSAWVRFEAELEEFEQSLLYDAQTSGGLLIALPREDALELCRTLSGAAIIGEVEAGGGEIVVR